MVNQGNPRPERTSHIEKEVPRMLLLKSLCSCE